MAAVKKNGAAIEFASEKLKKNEEIMRKAIVSNPKAYLFASHELLEHNEELSKIAFRGMGKTLINAPQNAK